MNSVLAPGLRSFGSIFLLRLRRWRRNMVAQIDRGKIIAQVITDGRLSYGYAFMVLISAGIATFGLLMNSSAVIIGAMLISPLMGPIVLAGLSLALAAPTLGARSGVSLLVGIFLSLAISVTIVHFSPLHSVTAEILSRTNPNLFDLLVAFLSGLAGGYAVVKGRGSALVGVAIATALMPPLAVVGYGLATRDWSITKGAGLLFLTNLLAIALAVAAVTLWYGFLPKEWQRRHILWQTLVATVVLVLLAIPLLNTLRSVASETSYTETARSILVAVAEKQGNGRLMQFNMTFPHGGVLEITAIMVTRHPEPTLESAAQNKLTKKLGRPVYLQLSQVRTWQVASTTALAAPVPNNPVQPSAATEQGEISRQLRQAFPLPLRLLDVNAAKKQITLLPSSGTTASLDTLRLMEKQLQRHYPKWRITLIPPTQSLPTIRFAIGSSAIDPTQQMQLQSIVWALQRWQLPRVDVIGRASTLGNRKFNEALAKARAEAVTQVLEARGIQAQAIAQFTAPGQLQDEPQRGFAYYQSVEIRLPAPVGTPLGNAHASTGSGTKPAG